ncbi:MAG TPA: sterol carrier family protein [Frankiaceae bacterium]|nr:sterol carrier family protein [Frankiaceae bacterium]
MPVRLPAGADALAGVTAQYALVSETVAALSDEAFALPTRLGTWTVAELVAHLASTLDAVPRALAKPAPAEPEADMLTYLGAMRAVSDAVAQRAVDNAAGVAPADLRARVAAAVTATEEALDGADPARLVLVRLGAVPLGDFLVTRCVEGVVHGLDLAAATGTPWPPDPTALKVVVRAFAALLEQVAPGRALEVRVPGHVAVQCLGGPRHTRGTPPNLAEADPVAFVEVSAGRLSWVNAIARGQIRASGKRSDLTEHLPLIG